eukprot:641924-Alexandrium_andersonii.AAC.1
MSGDPKEAQQTVDGVANTLQSAGIVTTRGPVERDTPEFLGFEFDAQSCVLRVKDRRFWRLKFALDHVIIAKPAVTGKE